MRSLFPRNPRKIKLLPWMRTLTWLGTLLITQAGGVVAQSPAPTLPDFAALEKAGATIGQIKINTQNIFDLEDAEENTFLYRLANRLHFPTRPDVVSKVLLFKTGDRISVQKIDETERLLRASGIRYEVEIKPIAYKDKDRVVDIEVSTRDSWTLDITANYSRSGGNNKTAYGLKEKNLLGTGLSIGFARTSDVDRSGSQVSVSYDQAFDGWTNVDFERGRYNDGKRTALTVDRPFYSLDTRFAGRTSFLDEDRIDSIYNAGKIVSEFRHRLRYGEVAGGWSPGLVNGWTQRFSAGALAQDNEYLAEPGRIAPTPLPVSNDVRGVFLRYQLLQDIFLKTKNHNQIERAEYFQLGFNGRAQLTRTIAGMGSSRADWLFAVALNDGYALSPTQKLLAGATLERRIGSTGLPMTVGGTAFKYYSQPTPQSLWYGALSLDRVRGGGIADQLLIGGASGLRGYPSRYQAGNQRALISLEKRVYSTWYPYRLFRIGGAVFADTGRAWGGPNQNLDNGGWLSDVGIGLRIALDRAAFANVLHVDIAAPLNRAADVKPIQFLVKTEFSF